MTYLTSEEEYARLLREQTVLPHCDGNVLHPVGTCEYCDEPKLKPLHEFRDTYHVNHTGENDKQKSPCFAERHRPKEIIDTWGGNRAKPTEAVIKTEVAKEPMTDIKPNTVLKRLDQLEVGDKFLQYRDDNWATSYWRNDRFHTAIEMTLLDKNELWYGWCSFSDRGSGYSDISPGEFRDKTFDRRGCHRFAKDGAGTAPPSMVEAIVPPTPTTYDGSVSMGATVASNVYSRCRACGAVLLPTNIRVADCCPCNAGRGINHGLVPKESCTCVECDPKQTGSTRYPFVETTTQEED